MCSNNNHFIIFYRSSASHIDLRGLATIMLMNVICSLQTMTAEGYLFNESEPSEPFYGQAGLSYYLHLAEVYHLLSKFSFLLFFFRPTWSVTIFLNVFHYVEE